MIKCKVCGCEFTPVIDKHYITRDNGESGISTAFKQVEGNLYDTFDCPACGCQIVAQQRKRVYRTRLGEEQFNLGSNWGYSDEDDKDGGKL